MSSLQLIIACTKHPPPTAVLVVMLVLLGLAFAALCAVCLWPIGDDR